MATADSFELKDPTTFTCPFCKGTFVVSPDVFAVLHSLPPCQTFLGTDVTAFLKKARKAGAEIVLDPPF